MPFLFYSPIYSFATVNKLLLAFLHFASIEIIPSRQKKEKRKKGYVFVYPQKQPVFVTTGGGRYYWHMVCRDHTKHPTVYRPAPQQRTMIQPSTSLLRRRNLLWDLATAGTSVLRTAHLMLGTAGHLPEFYKGHLTRMDLGLENLLSLKKKEAFK